MLIFKILSTCILHLIEVKRGCDLYLQEWYFISAVLHLASAAHTDATFELAEVKGRIVICFRILCF